MTSSTTNLPLDSDRHHIYRKVVGMLVWAAQVGPDLQFTAKDHTRHLASPTECVWQHLKHTLRDLKKTTHYKFLISPQLPQGHSLPHRQLIPLHTNTHCDSDWATDIDSRKSTSGAVTSVLQVLLAFNSRQLLQELQRYFQRPPFDTGNIDTQ